jgi:hypothetical protein
VFEKRKADFVNSKKQKNICLKNSKKKKYEGGKWKKNQV